MTLASKMQIYPKMKLMKSITKNQKDNNSFNKKNLNPYFQILIIIATSNNNNSKAKKMNQQYILM